MADEERQEEHGESRREHDRPDGQGAAADIVEGERQRVQIAAALAQAPAVLVLDEPTSQLDDEAAAEVLCAVADLAGQRGLTVVLSEHRLDRVREVVERHISPQDLQTLRVAEESEREILTSLALKQRRRR
jgi:energy-coupling factor transporter ATP-binding protein EcfA2